MFSQIDKDAQHSALVYSLSDKNGKSNPSFILIRIWSKSLFCIIIVLFFLRKYIIQEHSRNRKGDGGSLIGLYAIKAESCLQICKLHVGILLLSLKWFYFTIQQLCNKDRQTIVKYKKQNIYWGKSKTD